MFDCPALFFINNNKHLLNNSVYFISIVVSYLRIFKLRCSCSYAEIATCYTYSYSFTMSEIRNNDGEQQNGRCRITGTDT